MLDPGGAAATSKSFVTGVKPMNTTYFRPEWSPFTVLAMVLGHKAENAFHQSMILADGSVAVFWSNPLVGSIMTLAIALIVVPQLFRLVSRLRRRDAEPTAG